MWFALRLLVRNEQRFFNPSSKKLLGWIIGLLLVQLIYGAFMAGLKGALAAPTWPDINGSYVPSNMTSYQGKEGTFFSAMVNNPITIHFIHRNLAYLLTILVIVWTMKTFRQNRSKWFNRVKWLPSLLVLIQVILGIATVLTSVKKVPQRWGIFEWNAQLHQFVAMMLLLSLITSLFLHSSKKGAAV
jgi:cytochrome c oxidase assembly protein subunit 15